MGGRADVGAHDPYPHHPGPGGFTKEPPDVTQEPETEMTDSSRTTGTDGPEPQRPEQATSRSPARAVTASVAVKAGPAPDSHARRVNLEGLSAFYGSAPAV